ncbi:MAG: hypothetical protein DRO07_01440 [Candidatus Iainarchaeum archaeon]|uniref:Uncharacterized protein n=1 Tax=Candidatus Iainarchaeum sp. TaxID=3101447 RepID=A0A497JHJ7_9ARCH|nr:MAG: hypothetical protein DRO07_01440 [Candidatus Diapherotrites archaeon]
MSRFLRTNGPPKKAQAPKTNVISVRFDPNMSPTLNPGTSSSVEKIAMLNSGSDVDMEIIMNPIVKVDMPKIREVLILSVTTHSLLFTSSKALAINIAAAMSIKNEVIKSIKGFA